MVKLEEEFIRYIEHHSLFDLSRKVILAVSGGVDSMVMVDLFQRNRIPYMIAHCNFGLRGIESDGDELLVGALANKYKVPFVAKSFNTHAYSKQRKCSIEVAARELRYSWFAKLATEENLETVVLAHHADDVAETMLINLCRGTGISGLHGILPRNGLYARPLLFAQRSDILAYATERNIKFREDSTNKEEKYSRNNIRKNVLPALRKSYPEVVHSFSRSASIIREQEVVYRAAVERILSQITIKSEHHTAISISRLISCDSPEVALFESLNPFGFNSAQVADILSNIERHSGAVYRSDTHQVVRDRENLFLSKIEEPRQTESYVIEDIHHLNHLPIALGFQPLDSVSMGDIKQNEPNSIVVDADKLTFPLVLRKWEQGDFFTPLGMNGRKKLSDFFQDLKIPSHMKSHIYILESNKKIVWIVGYRMSDLVKVGEKSSNYLKIFVD